MESMVIDPVAVGVVSQLNANDLLDTGTEQFSFGRLEGM